MRNASPPVPAKPSAAGPVRFGTFQLDSVSGHLLKSGLVVPIKPQPFKLLQLLLDRAGQLVTREEIRQALWGTDTYVDFEGGVNTAVRQVRDALGDDAERPLFVETVPRRGYRFIAPVERGPSAPPRVEPRGTDLNLQKALWLNIAEIRLAEERRRRMWRRALAAGATVLGLALIAYLTTLLAA